MSKSFIERFREVRAMLPPGYYIEDTGAPRGERRMYALRKCRHAELISSASSLPQLRRAVEKLIEMENAP